MVFIPQVLRKSATGTYHAEFLISKCVDPLSNLLFVPATNLGTNLVVRSQ